MNRFRPDLPLTAPSLRDWKARRSFLRSRGGGAEVDGTEGRTSGELIGERIDGRGGRVGREGREGWVKEEERG